MKWYNFMNGGKVPMIHRQTGGAVPGTQASLVPNSAAQVPWDTYLAGTNPYTIAGGYGVKGTPGQYDYSLYTGLEPVAPVTTTTDDGSSGFDGGVTKTVDSAGVPAPYLGVDQYDLEGDDNFLDKDEYQKEIDTITNQYDSWTGDGYDPTKTFEEQLSAEDYQDFYNSSLGENPAQMAADTIYNNNQQIYGEETGNNITSLVTGNVTGLDDAGIAELQNADDDATWAGDSSPVSQLINQQADDYASTGKVFDMNDPSTWADSSSSNDSIVDKATGLVSGGGDDGVGNFGAVGDFFGGIGDSLGITDYAGEAKAAEEAAAAEAAAAEAQRQADAEVARQVAEREAAAAEAERQRVAAEQEAARIAAEEEAARIAAEEAAAAESNITEDGEIDWDSQQTTNAQELLAAGEIDFVEYLNQIGYYDTANSGIDLGFQVGVGSPGSAGHSQAPATDTGYVAADGPVHTKTGEHTVENEMDGATATDNYKKAKNNSNDDPHMSHDEIIAHHKNLEKAETDLIQSDLSDDDFWDAYDDDDGGSDDGGGSSNDTSTVICTALMEMGELDPTIWKYDLMYGEQYVSDTTYRGYHDWAIPMVPKVKARHWLYFPLAKVMAKAWAYQMAHFMSNGEHGSSSLLGKAICWFGEGYCTWRGKRIEAREEGGNYAKS